MQPMKKARMKGTAIAGILIVLIIGLVIGFSLISSTSPTVINGYKTTAGGNLENLSATGKIIADFIPILYLLIPIGLAIGAYAAVTKLKLH